jgi:hypothetical protein
MHPVPDNAEQYWQRPQFKDEGDDNPDPLWYAIGVTATSWESLEESFAKLFRVFVESRSSAADRAYGAIASARGRRDALDAASEVFFTLHNVEDIWQREYKLLMRHFALAGGVRNEIVHGVLVYFGFTRGPGAGNFLVPAGYNTRKTHAFHGKNVPEGDHFAFAKAKYRYTAKDVDDITVRISALDDCVREWTMNLWVTYPSDKYDKAE